MSTTTMHGTTGNPPRPSRRTRGLAVIGATVAALAVWAVAGKLADVELTVRMGGSGSETQQVSAATVAIASLLVGLAGWVLLAMLEHFTARARAVWTSLALVVLAVSLFGPLSGGVTTGAKVALLSMHLVVAAVLIPALARSVVRR